MKHRSMLWVRVLALAAAAGPALAPDAWSQEQEFDILLKGGHVIDPANKVNGRLDVGIKGEKIAAVHKEIPVARAGKVVDVSRYYVTPGFIDLHAHARNGRVPPAPSYPPDMNFSAGVTTIVDAGSWGADDFQVMRKHVIAPSWIRVLSLLNISAGGMGPPEQDVKQLDPLRCAETIRANRDVIVGIKSAHYWTRAPWDAEHSPWASVERAVECGKLANVPVMVDFWPRPPERPFRDLILEKLRPGDILTHTFGQHYDTIDGKGKVEPYMWEARKRGVFFDVGHGAGSFWFRIAAAAIQQGFKPDSISTDLHMRNVNGPVVDMATTMSKLLVLGMTLEEVIRAATENPARQIRRPELGTLSVGRDADIAVIEVEKGRFTYADCGRATLVGNVRIVNRMTLRAGLIPYDPYGLSMVEWRKAPAQYFAQPPDARKSPATADQRYEDLARKRGRPITR